MSGGQLQRVLLARTLTQGADILLLDEAFSAVDIGAEEDVMKIINEIKQDGKTILIATHDINNIEEKYDEVLCLNRHCCAFGNPSEVLTEEVIEEMYGSHNQNVKRTYPWTPRSSQWELKLLLNLYSMIYGSSINYSNIIWGYAFSSWFIYDK